MTNLVCDVQNVIGEPIKDGVVRLSSADIQYHGSKVILPDFHEAQLVNGSTTFTGVSPGRAVIQVFWDINRTATLRVTVPDKPSVALSELVLQRFDSEPLIVGQVASSAESAAISRDAAAQYVADAKKQADTAGVYARNAQANYGAAWRSKNDAAKSEANAAASATAAAGSATASAGSATKAAASEKAAAASAAKAATEVSALSTKIAAGNKLVTDTNAAYKALSAKITGFDPVWKEVTAAAAQVAEDKAAAEAAQAAAEAVKVPVYNWKNDAQSAASAAAGFAREATAAATKSSQIATAVQNIDSSISWSGDQLHILGKVSPHLKGDKGAPGEVSNAQLTAALKTKADLVGGKVPTSQIPAVALTKPRQVVSRAAMLALDAQEGDVAIITTGPDKGSYMLGTGPKTVFSSWLELATSQDAPVASVNGQTGTVVLAPGDVGAAPVAHRHRKADITDLEPIEYAANPGSIVKRALGGHVTLPTEVGGSNMAASVGYVDTTVANVDQHISQAVADIGGTMQTKLQDVSAKVAAVESSVTTVSKQVEALTPWVGPRSALPARRDPNRLYIIKGA